MARWIRTLCAMVVAAIGLAAVLGACATREIPYPELKTKYGLPSSHMFEPEPGLRVHYTEEGKLTGRTLVLVHGFAASVHAWRPWIERLGPDFHLIAIDLPGHGLTEAPQDYQATIEGNVALVGKLADKAGASHFVLAGNSMGGAVAIAFAMAHPERLEGLVLVDAAGWPGDESESAGGPPFFVGLINNPVGRFFLKLLDPRVFASGGLKSAYLDESLVTDRLVDRYAELALAPGHRDILLTQRPQPAKPITPADFDKITVPTLVLAGEQDKLIPVDLSRSIAAAIPGARLITYPEGGHLPMEQLPDKSAADLRAFLDSIPQR